MPSSEQNPRFVALAGYPVDYGSKEARQALANLDAGVGGGGGGGGAVTIDYYGDGSNSPATTLNNTASSVGTANTVILNTDTGRYFVQIQNLSNNELFINFNVPATTSNGLKILPDGSWQSYDPLFVQAAINAVGSSTGTNYVIFYTT